MDLSGDAGLSDEGGCPCLPAAAGCRRDGKRDVREAPNHAVRSWIPLSTPCTTQPGLPFPAAPAGGCATPISPAPAVPVSSAFMSITTTLSDFPEPFQFWSGGGGKIPWPVWMHPPKPDRQVGVPNGTQALHLWPRVQKKDSKRAQKGSSENVSNQIR